MIFLCWLHCLIILTDFDCDAAWRTLRKHFSSFVSLPILPLLPLLLSNNVITLAEKAMIEHKQERELKGMDYFLTEVIMTSLKLKVKDKYKGFLLSMEQHENLLFKIAAQHLGRYNFSMLVTSHTCVWLYISVGGSESVRWRLSLLLYLYAVTSLEPWTL